MQRLLIIISDDKMNEDELPKDLPNSLYNWWFGESFVDFVRLGPIIKDVSQPGSRVDRAIEAGCKKRIGECEFEDDCKYCPDYIPPGNSLNR